MARRGLPVRQPCLRRTGGDDLADRGLRPHRPAGCERPLHPQRNHRPAPGRVRAIRACGCRPGHPWHPRHRRKRRDRQCGQRHCRRHGRAGGPARGRHHPAPRRNPVGRRGRSQLDRRVPGPRHVGRHGVLARCGLDQPGSRARSVARDTAGGHHDRAGRAAEGWRSIYRPRDGDPARRDRRALFHPRDRRRGRLRPAGRAGGDKRQCRCGGRPLCRVGLRRVGERQQHRHGRVSGGLFRTQPRIHPDHPARRPEGRPGGSDLLHRDQYRHAGRPGRTLVRSCLHLARWRAGRIGPPAGHVRTLQRGAGPRRKLHGRGRDHPARRYRGSVPYPVRNRQPYGRWWHLYSLGRGRGAERAARLLWQPRQRVPVRGRQPAGYRARYRGLSGPRPAGHAA